jgi:hypothetical protein
MGAKLDEGIGETVPRQVPPDGLDAAHVLEE